MSSRQSGARPANTLRELAEWLVSMDDPADEFGCKERQRVTLTQIVDRAREALEQEPKS
jgi:hypothetical protein